MYDQEVSHAAIDAGADLVLGHHTLMKGIEQYKGKNIFHGLGLFCPVAKEWSEVTNKSKTFFPSTLTSLTFYSRNHTQPDIRQNN